MRCRYQLSGACLYPNIFTNCDVGSLDTLSLRSPPCSTGSSTGALKPCECDAASGTEPACVANGVCASCDACRVGLSSNENALSSRWYSKDKTWLAYWREALGSSSSVTVYKWVTSELVNTAGYALAGDAAPEWIGLDVVAKSDTLVKTDDASEADFIFYYDKHQVLDSDGLDLPELVGKRVSPKGAAWGEAIWQSMEWLSEVDENAVVKGKPGCGSTCQQEPEAPVLRHPTADLIGPTFVKFEYRKWVAICPTPVRNLMRHLTIDIKGGRTATPSRAPAPRAPSARPRRCTSAPARRPSSHPPLLSQPLLPPMRVRGGALVSVAICL